MRSSIEKLVPQVGGIKIQMPLSYRENELHCVFSIEYEGWDCNQSNHFALDIGYHVIKS